MQAFAWARGADVTLTLLVVPREGEACGCTYISRIISYFCTNLRRILHVFHRLPWHPKDSAQEPAQAQNSSQSW